MNSELTNVNCPVCNNPISLNNKHWVITTCSACKNEVQIVLDKGKPMSVRSYLSLAGQGRRDMDEIFIEYVKTILPVAKWGFNRSIPCLNGHILDSDSCSCRVKFELSGRDYYPLTATNIYYGRQHAPDDERYLEWNGKKCLCWHSNIQIVLAFIDGVPAQQLVDIDKYTEIWNSRLDILKVDYPPEGHLEYPLRLHAKIWEHYGDKLFSVFDLRKTQLWEQYSEFSDKYHELRNEYLHRRFDISREVERIC